MSINRGWLNTGYYAITIHIKLDVLRWKEIYDVLLNFFFKVKYILQNTTPPLV